MEYIFYNIPSFIIPKKAFRIDEIGIIYFPSKVKNGVANSFSSLGVVIFNKDLIYKNTISLLEDSIKFLSICQPDFHSYRWLSQQNYNQSEFDKKKRNCTSINDVILEYIDKKPKGIDLKDFSAFTYSIDNFQEAFNILELFKAYRVIENGDSLKNMVNLFSFARNCDPFISRVYNNQNLKISLMFTILDEIMPNEEIDKKVKCVYCNKVHVEKGKLKTKNRIKRFVSDLQLDTNNKALLFAVINHMYCIRNDFFHEGLYESLNDKIKKLSNATGRKNFTLKDELKHIEGRFSGILWVEHIIRAILFQMLSEINRVEKYES